ncbi:MAG: sulfatase-like hydrolase/transferase [Holophagales bacterium]|nr:sulfatase-like hydrolase/transferase [Holophagales bacterium]
MRVTEAWGPFERRPNLLIIITDQQRTLQHFPPGWAERYLPWLTYLQRTGVTFARGMASATACSPSRSTLFTSTYPTVNGVLVVNDTLSLSRTLPMGGSLTTLGTVLHEAGYLVKYKGKWHLDSSFADFSTLRPVDEDRRMISDDAFETRIAIEDESMRDHYAFPAWTSPDLGTSESAESEPVDMGPDSDLNSIGGGFVDNDARIVKGPLYASGQSSAVDFLREYDPSNEPPFCLVVSMANPHDVWLYPYSYEEAGYDAEAWAGAEYEGFQLPRSYFSSLENKPTAQKEWQLLFQPPPLEPPEALEYVKFYAYLQTLVDGLTGDLIRAMRSNQHTRDLERNTLVVRLSDHGEMAMAQSSMRQKENNCYEETIRVPMIFSNPLLPQNERRDSLVGLIDVMPTLAKVAGVEDLASRWVIQGRSFAQELLDGPAETRRRYLFVTDDCSGSYTSIRTIVEAEWKYAVYYRAKYGNILNYNGEVDSDISLQYELYDNGPDGQGETVNLLDTDGSVPDDESILRRWQQLHAALTRMMTESYTLPDSWPMEVPTEESNGGNGGEEEVDSGGG